MIRHEWIARDYEEAVRLAEFLRAIHGPCTIDRDISTRTALLCFEVDVGVLAVIVIRFSILREADYEGYDLTHLRRMADKINES